MTTQDMNDHDIDPSVAPPAAYGPQPEAAPVHLRAFAQSHVRLMAPERPRVVVDLSWPAGIAVGFVGTLGLLALAVGLGVLVAWLL